MARRYSLGYLLNGSIRLFGWRPLFDLEGGFTRTIDWHREFLAGSQ